MNKTMKCICLTLAILLPFLFLNAGAMAAPTAQMVKEVVDYYYEGQKDGPILIDAKLCKDIKEFECGEPVDPSRFAVGETINVWMRFFVPKGGQYDDILVEYRHEGIPWRLIPHKVEGSIRYRVIDKFSLAKPGNWTIYIKRGVKKLHEFNVKVVE